MHLLSGNKYLKKIIRSLQTYWRHIGAVFFFLLLAGIWQRDPLAIFVWEKLNVPYLALRLNSANPALAMKIGDHYFGQPHYNLSLAERAYEKALTIDPATPYVHYQLARVHFIRRQYATALSDLEKELEANPGNFRSYYMRGLIYGYGGNLENAEINFRTFTQWAPLEWAGYNDLAWILLKRKKYQEAKDVIETSLRIVPEGTKNPWLWNSLGASQLNLKEYAAAKHSFEWARDLAAKLTPFDWQRAYPGNNPQERQYGLTSFLEAIQQNILRASQLSRGME